ncbi:MAG: peroxiredoxin [Planctomycetes bacterium]|nr:peroxiredoxin [Planctomycetota bacterium]
MLAGLILLAGCSEPVQSKGPVKIGDMAPDFSLKSDKGETIRLSDQRGSVVVVFFYPKDNTSICTKEVCAFRDSYDAFKEHGVKVFGVSSDSVESHQGFSDAQRLNYPILSDEGAKVRKLWGVPKTLGVIAGRVTYVIDKEGVVRHIFNSQTDAQKHVDEAMRIIKELK